MKHIKNYMKVKKAMRDYFKKELAEAKKAFEVSRDSFGNPECFDAENNCYRLKEGVRWVAAGHVVTEVDVEDRRVYFQKTLQKTISRWEERLDAADKAGKLIEINIRVEWSNNRHGSDPRATAWLCYEDEKFGSNTGMGTGSASGGGYDKGSAAVFEALCFNVSRRHSLEARRALADAKASLDRFVIEHGEELWKEYAIDRKPFPHFHFDGKGMSTFTSLFRRIGCKSYGAAVGDYLIDYYESPKGADVYHVIRKDRI